MGARLRRDESFRRAVFNTDLLLQREKKAAMKSKKSEQERKVHP